MALRKILEVKGLEVMADYPDLNKPGPAGKSGGGRAVHGKTSKAIGTF